MLVELREMYPASEARLYRVGDRGESPTGGDAKSSGVRIDKRDKPPKCGPTVFNPTNHASPGQDGLGCQICANFASLSVFPTEVRY